MRKAFAAFASLGQHANLQCLAPTLLQSVLRMSACQLPNTVLSLEGAVC